MADHVNDQSEMTSNLTVKPHEPDESGPDRTTEKRITELIHFCFEFSVLGPRGRPFYWKVIDANFMSTFSVFVRSRPETAWALDASCS